MKANTRLQNVGRARNTYIVRNCYAAWYVEKSEVCPSASEKWVPCSALCNFLFFNFVQLATQPPIGLYFIEPTRVYKQIVSTIISQLDIEYRNFSENKNTIFLCSQFCSYSSEYKLNMTHPSFFIVSCSFRPQFFFIFIMKRISCACAACMRTLDSQIICYIFF